MKFSIIIPTYNNVELLKKCIGSIMKHTDLSETEIIVVANGCTDGTESYLFMLDNTTENLKVLWYKEPLGYTVATNKGIQAASGSYLVLLNNDTEFLDQEKGTWLNMLYEPFSKDKEVAITGCTKVSKPELLNKPFLIFFCVMINPKLTGLLDEVFNPGYGEDADMCWKAEQHGYKVVQVPDQEPPETDGKQYLSRFPIWHVSTQTFKDVAEYPEVVKRNTKILEERYGDHFDGFKDIEVPKRKTGDIPQIKSNVKVGDMLTDHYNHMLVTKVEKDIFSETMTIKTFNIQRAKTIDGWMLESELLVLAKLASNAKVFIEVGSWKGKSSRAVADNLPEDGILFCIDTWDGSKDEENYHGEAKMLKGDGVFTSFINSNFDLIMSGKIVPLRMHSDTALLYFDSLVHNRIKADVIFIDGDHTYEGVKEDLLWEKILKPDGVLCGHDYVWDHPGVIKAVDEKFGKDVSTFPDTSIWKYTPKSWIDKKTEELSKKNSENFETMIMQGTPSSTLKFGIGEFDEKGKITSVVQYEHKHQGYGGNYTKDFIDMQENALRRTIEKETEELTRKMNEGFSNPFMQGSPTITSYPPDRDEPSFKEAREMFLNPKKYKEFYDPSAHHYINQEVDDSKAIEAALKSMPDDNKIKVTVGIPTRDRYDILANCLQSIIFQTYQPHEIIVVDDTENAPNLQDKFPLYDYLIKTAVEKGIKFRVIYGKKLGPQYSHQTIQESAEGDWILRIDDDCVMEPDGLQKLVAITSIDKVGAVAPLVLLPFAEPFTSGRNMIKHMGSANVQWLKKVSDDDGRQFEAQDHLYSCFLYKKGIANYNLSLSKMGFREETLFSYRILRAGYDLRINPNAVVHHFRSNEGGIRPYEKDKVMYEHDEGTFRSFLSLWDANPDETKVVVIDGGIGDHWAFKHILPVMIKKYGKVKIACCYTDVFFDIDKTKIEIISIADAQQMFWGCIDQFDIYKRMFDWNWKENTVKAFRKLYLETLN